MKKQKGLGQGLDALLGDPDHMANDGQSDTRHDEAARRLPMAAIRQGKYQPRTSFDHDALQTLADSIREHGVMQPILVRRLNEEDVATGPTYEIVAGERRYRAAERAGLTDIPVVVCDFDDRTTLAVALIENIQRENLNPIDEALAIRRLIEEFSYSHDAAAQAIGRSRSATSNLLRLLNLANPVQQMLVAGQLDMGHARALLPLPGSDQVLLAKHIVNARLSVREAEVLVQQQAANEAALNQADQITLKPSRQVQDPDIHRLQEQLSNLLASDVQIRANARGGGKLTIRFSDGEQFEGLLDSLGLRQRLNEDS